MFASTFNRCCWKSQHIFSSMWYIVQRCLIRKESSLCRWRNWRKVWFENEIFTRRYGESLDLPIPPPPPPQLGNLGKPHSVALPELDMLSMLNFGFQRHFTGSKTLQVPGIGTEWKKKTIFPNHKISRFNLKKLNDECVLPCMECRRKITKILGQSCFKTATKSNKHIFVPHLAWKLLVFENNECYLKLLTFQSFLKNSFQHFAFRQPQSTSYFKCFLNSRVVLTKN